MSTYVVQNTDVGLYVHFFPRKGDTTDASWRVSMRIGGDMTLYLSEDEVRDLAGELHNVVDRLDEENEAPATARVPDPLGGPVPGTNGSHLPEEDHG